MIETPRKIIKRVPAERIAEKVAVEQGKSDEADGFELISESPPQNTLTPPKTLPAPHERLFDDALAMTVNRNLDDVSTLLQWAREVATPQEKLKHVKRAVELLADVRDSLEELR